MAKPDVTRVEAQMRDIGDGEMGASEVDTIGIDVYITQYAAKPMEQSKSVVAHYALGINPLDVKKEWAAWSDSETDHLPAAVGTLQGV